MTRILVKAGLSRQPDLMIVIGGLIVGKIGTGAEKPKVVRKTAKKATDLPNTALT